MTSVRAQIVNMVEQIPDGDLQTVLEVMRHFIPADADDTATAEDINAHNIALNEYRAGETVPHDGINWN